MNFLKKAGLILGKIAGVIAEIMGVPFVSQMLGIKPAVTNAVTTVMADLNSIAAIITEVEATFAAINDPAAKTGSQKLLAAAPQVQNVLTLWGESNLPGHNKVKDPAKLQAAAAQIAGGMADLLSAFGD